MTVITVTETIVNGSLRIPLGKSCACFIGLVAIGYPSTIKTVDITCPQIDSTIYNRKRLLRRILFGSINKNDKYGVKEIYKEFKNVIYEKLDSTDDFLNLEISENGELVKNSRKVTLILSFIKAGELKNML